MQKIFLYIFLFLNYTAVISQEMPYYFPDIKSTKLRYTHWTIDKGLPSQGLRDIFQSSDRYIWLASYEGLIRFDGFEFKLFNSQNTEAFKNNVCVKTLEDKNNVLWILTMDGLIYYQNGNFKQFIFEDDFGDLAQKMFIDSNNRIWLNSEKQGVFYIKNKKVHTFKHPIFSNGGIWATTEDDKGNVYFQTKTGSIVKFNGENFTHYMNPDSLTANFKFLHFFNNKLYWINDFGKLSYYTGKTIKTDSLFFSQLIYSVSIDKNGDRWISTANNIYRQKKQKTNCSLVIPSRGLIFDQTYLDYEGNLWAKAYRKGLVKINVGKFDIYTPEFDLHGKICNAVCEIDTGVMLLGYDNGVIDKIEKNKISLFLSAKKLKNTRIRHLLKDSKGNLWISTYSGLLKINSSGKFIWFDKKNGFPDNKIKMVFEDSKQNIWVATATKGIIKIDKNNKFYSFPQYKKLIRNQILSIKEDKKGTLFISTTNYGLFLLQNDKLTNISKINGVDIISVFNTYIDKEGTVWIVSNGRGIFRYKNNRFFAFNYKNGLANNSPFDLIEDNYGNFWIPYNTGVMKVSKKQLNNFADGKINKYECVVFDKETHKAIMFTPVAKSFKASNGSIWLPMLNGIAVLNPDKISKNKIPPKVHLEKFIVDSTNLLHENNIIIDAGKQHYDFKFTAICFRNPDKVKFKYKLEGFDKNWTITDKNIRNVSYTNLTYGNYTFKVTACNNDGIWNKKGTEIHFTIKPFFYETICFKIGIILFVFLLAFIIYKLRILKIKKNEKYLKKIVLERTALIRAQKREIEMQNEEMLNINNMLEKQKKQLQEHKNQLEKLVKKRTKELEIAKLKAEQSDKLKSAFLNNISHEIRTPLNGILGFIQILKTDGISEKSKEKYMDIIIESSEQLLKIVNEIVYISKIQAGIEQINRTEISLLTLLNDLFDYYDLIAKSKKLVLKKVLQGCDILISTDIEKLRQILSVLIENAIKFTEKGYIEIGCKKITSFVQFYVKDSGIGIPLEKENTIFDKFIQVDESTTRQHGGLGLGLSISKAYVKFLGGQIWFESEINKGTTFYFTIPV